MKGSGPVKIKDNKWRFSVWAPEIKTMSLHLKTPNDRTYPMQKDDEGYFIVECDDITPGACYFYQPDNDSDLPDPASNFQPNGVHDRSAVVDHSLFQWTDDRWRGRPLRDLIIYELHVGTFTDKGTFEAAISRLDDLVETGINAIEIMPVAQFPGKRNWGYDGVYPYAVQNSYGGPDGLKLLVDACHSKGIVVILDVVYNHMGPEGNIFNNYGPYFSKSHHVPWGDSINFDQQWSDGVRDYFLNNINHWIVNYHIDGLRLDAIHTIFDSNPIHILDALNRRADSLREETGRDVFLIAESDLNDPRVIKHQSVGGYGFNAQWLDDYHHALYVLIHPAGKKRYADFGSIYQLEKAFTSGFVHTGEFVNFRKRKYGGSSQGIASDRFVVFNQNHDQVGNRVLGERLTSLVDKDGLMLAAAGTILSPYIPMLFMGEEYAEDAPFTYFVDHSDKKLIEAVREGRNKEFADFADEGQPKGAETETTFLECKLKWDKRHEGQHQAILNWYKALINFRKTSPVFNDLEKKCLHVSVIAPKCMSVYWHVPDFSVCVYMFYNFSDTQITYPLEGNGWKEVLNSKGKNEIVGSSIILQPTSFVVYQQG